TVERETKLALRLEPGRVEGISGAGEIVEHAQKIRPDEMSEHELVAQRRTPARERAALRRAPEPGDERAQEQLLGKAHARVGRHFERAEFDQAEPPGRAVGRI